MHTRHWGKFCFVYKVRNIARVLRRIIQGHICNAVFLAHGQVEKNEETTAKFNKIYSFQVYNRPYRFLGRLFMQLDKYSLGCNWSDRLSSRYMHTSRNSREPQLDLYIADYQCQTPFLQNNQTCLVPRIKNIN